MLVILVGVLFVSRGVSSGAARERTTASDDSGPTAGEICAAVQARGYRECQRPLLRRGSNSHRAWGCLPVVTCSANSRPVTGPYANPHLPCPPATYTPRDTSPISGRPSGVTGCAPTHSLLRSSQRTPSNKGLAEATMASTRSGMTRSCGWRNSVLSETRIAPL